MNRTGITIETPLTKVASGGQLTSGGGGGGHVRLHDIDNPLDHSAADEADYGKIVWADDETGAIEFSDGSGLFILNQKAAAQTANFWIEGDGKVKGNLYVEGQNANNYVNILSGDSTAGYNSVTIAIEDNSDDEFGTAYLAINPEDGIGFTKTQGAVTSLFTIGSQYLDFQIVSAQLQLYPTYLYTSVDFGIKTTSPTRALDINGYLRIRDLGDGSDYTYLLAADADGNVDRVTKSSILAPYLPLAGGTMDTTTLVTNMNADLLDGQHGAYYLDYTNFTNTPEIPGAQIQSNWTQTTTTALDYIKNKPTIPAVGGSDTQVQFNDSSAFAGATYNLYNKTSGKTTIGRSGDTYRSTNYFQVYGKTLLDQCNVNYFYLFDQNDTSYSASTGYIAGGTGTGLFLHGESKTNFNLVIDGASSAVLQVPTGTNNITLSADRVTFSNYFISPTAKFTDVGTGTVAYVIGITSDGTLTKTDAGETPVLNSVSADGLVLKGTGNNNKVWATDDDGDPGWRTVSSEGTTYSAAGAITLTGTEFTHTDTSSQASVSATSRTYITAVTLDTYGHVTSLSTGTETVTDTNTWDANSLNVAGYVSAPTSANPNKVWKTDGDGNPGWRADAVGSGGLSNPFTAAGQLMYGTGGGDGSEYAVLSLGTNGKVLTSNGSTLLWATPTGGGTGTVTSVTAGNGLNQSGVSTVNPTIYIESETGTPDSIGTLVVNADKIGVSLGTTSTTAAAGNHVHTGVYDKYEYFTAYAGTGSVGNIGSKGSLSFLGSTSISVSFDDDFKIGFSAITGTTAGTVAAGNHTHTNMVDGSGTANKLAMWSDSNTITDAPLLSWTTTGIPNNTHGLVLANATTDSFNTGMFIQNKSEGITNYPVLQFYKSDGGETTENNAILGWISFCARSNDTDVQGAAIKIKADNLYSVANKSKMEFFVSSGIDSVTPALVINSDKTIYVYNAPTYADNTAAASLATGTVYKTATGTLMIKY